MQKYASIRPGIVSRRELAQIQLSQLLAELEKNYSTSFLGREPRQEAQVLAKLFGGLLELISSPIEHYSSSNVNNIRKLVSLFFLDPNKRIDCFDNLKEFNPFLVEKIANFRTEIKGVLQLHGAAVQFYGSTTLARLITPFKAHVEAIVDDFLFMPHHSLSLVLENLRNITTSTTPTRLLLIIDDLFRHIDSMFIEEQIYYSGTLSLIVRHLDQKLPYILDSIKTELDEISLLKLSTQLRKIIANIKKIEIPDDDELINSRILEDNCDLEEVISTIAAKFELPEPQSNLLEDIDTFDKQSINSNVAEACAALQKLLNIILHCHDVINSSKEPARVNLADYELVKALLLFIKKHSQAYFVLINDLARVENNLLGTSFYNTIHRFLILLTVHESISTMLVPAYSRKGDKELKYFTVNRVLHAALTDAYTKVSQHCAVRPSSDNLSESLASDDEEAFLLDDVDNLTLPNSTSPLNKLLISDLQNTRLFSTLAKETFHNDPEVSRARKLLRTLYDDCGNFYQDIFKAYLIGSQWLVYLILTADGVRLAEQTTVPPESLVHGLLKSCGSIFLLGVTLNSYHRFAQRLSPHMKVFLDASIKDPNVKKAFLFLARYIDLSAIAGTISANNAAMMAIFFKALMDNISALNELFNYFTGVSEGLGEAYTILSLNVPITAVAFILLRLNFIDLPKLAHAASTMITTEFPSLPSSIIKVTDRFFDAIADAANSKKGHLARYAAAISQDLLRHFLYTFVIAFPALAILKTTELFTDIPYEVEKGIELGIYSISFLVPATIANTVQSVLRSDGIIIHILRLIGDFISSYQQDLKDQGNLHKAPKALQLYGLLADQVNRFRYAIGLHDINATNVEDSIVYFLTSPFTRALLATGNIFYVVYFITLAIQNDAFSNSDLYAALPAVGLAAVTPFLFLGTEFATGYFARRIAPKDDTLDLVDEVDDALIHKTP